MKGIFSKTTDSNFVEAAGIAGLNFIILDCEHGIVNREILCNHIRAAKLTKMKAIVRVPSLNKNAIGTVYDLGADMAMVPGVDTIEQMNAVVSAIRFNQERGVCKFVRAAEYGNLDKEKYFAQQNIKGFSIQLESSEAIMNAAGFFSHEEAKRCIFFIGPNDLARSVGLPGEITHPDVVKVMENTAKLAKEFEVTLGTFTENAEQSIKMRQLGFSFIAQSVDVNIFLEGCKSIHIS